MLSVLKPHRTYGYQEFTGLNPIKYIVLSWLRLRYSIGLIRKDFPGDGQDFYLTLPVDTQLRWQMGHGTAFASAPRGDFNGSDLQWNTWSFKHRIQWFGQFLRHGWKVLWHLEMALQTELREPSAHPWGLLSFSLYFLMFLLKIIKT